MISFERKRGEKKKPGFYLMDVEFHNWEKDLVDGGEFVRLSQTQTAKVPVIVMKHSMLVVGRH